MAWFLFSLFTYTVTLRPSKCTNTKLGNECVEVLHTTLDISHNSEWIQRERVKQRGGEEEVVWFGASQTHRQPAEIVQDWEKQEDGEGWRLCSVERYLTHETLLGYLEKLWCGSSGYLNPCLGPGLPQPHTKASDSWYHIGESLEPAVFANTPYTLTKEDRGGA